MASEDERNRKCFAITWKIENASYCSEKIQSPLFTVDEIQETKWKLEFYPFHGAYNNFGFYLRRHTGNESSESVKIDCDHVFLSSDGEVLTEVFKRKNAEIRKSVGVFGVPSRHEVFSKRRSEFLPKDTLTVRCRMWKSVGEMSKDVHCFARTRIVVEKRSFMWNIENFSCLDQTKKKTIKSLDKRKNFMSLELFLRRGLFFDETIRLKIIPDYQNIKNSTFQLSIVDASKNAVKCFQDEFWHRDSCESKLFTLFCTKNELLEKKSTYLPDDILTLSCECTFSFGNLLGEIEKVDSDCIAKLKKKLDYSSISAENEISAPKCMLLDNLKSMFNNSCVSDVKLKTKGQTYPAHKFILSARSPVFMAMFSNDMKEKIKDCVDIEDLNDDILLRMLRYIYSAEVEELDWESASKLYEAADKYQILNLRDICSSFMKTNLSANKACDALLLADLHQDEDLKGFVQNFIIRHGKDIINSEEWEQLADANMKLAFETMRLKFKE